MALTITWLGQSGYLLNNGQGTLAVDPFCGRPQQGMRRIYEPDEALRGTHVDMVACSHPHWDHFDPFTYREFVIPKTFLGPSSCIRAMQADETMRAIETVTLNCGQTYAAKGFELTAVLADHDNDSIGIVVRSEGVTLYFTGDTIFSSNLLMRNFGIHPDIICVCINGKYGNMHYVEAALYCSFQHARYAIPAHHDMIQNNTEDPESFVSALGTYAPETKGRILERGRAYDVHALMD